MITTRNEDCTVHGTVGKMLLESLEPEPAQELLLRAARIPERLWNEKREAASDVTELLGYHTLAIVQAGAFVRKKLCSLENYRTHFQLQKRQLLTFHSNQIMSTYGNVYATFEVSAESLQKSTTTECSDALSLLHVLAFFHNNGISEEIFQLAAEYAPETETKTIDISGDGVFPLSVSHLARLPEYLQQPFFSRQDSLRWRKACLVLASLSLVKLDEDDQSLDISMHPLVHAWAKERQDEQARCRAWQSAATILALSCQGNQTWFPPLVMLQPHVRACVGHEFDAYTQDMSGDEVGQIGIQFAALFNWLHDHISLSSFIPHIESSLSTKSSVDVQIILEIKRFSGLVSMEKGDYEHAARIYKEIYESRARVFAGDNPLQLRVKQNLARALIELGRNDEAVGMLEHLVKVREKLEIDHPNRLASEHNLSWAYLKTGRTDEAIEILEHIVKVEEKLEIDHPERLASEYELSNAYLKADRVNEAIKILKHLIKVGEKLKIDHPNRFASAFFGLS